MSNYGYMNQTNTAGAAVSGHFVVCKVPDALLQRLNYKMRRLAGHPGKQSLTQVVFFIDVTRPTPESSIIGEIRWARGLEIRPMRDRWINWGADIRSVRISQVAELRHLVFTDSKFRAHQGIILRKALLTLPDDWKREFGFKPLLAECAAGAFGIDERTLAEDGWAELAMDSSREPSDGKRAGRPAPGWVMELESGAKSILASPLDGVLEPIARVSLGVKDLPDFTCDELRQLVRELSSVRVEGRRKGFYPLGSVLAIVCASRISGRSSGQAHQRWAAGLSEEQREAIGLTSNKLMRAPEIPSHDTIRRTCNLIRRNPQALASMTGSFNRWLNSLGRPPFEGRLIW